MLGPTGCNSSRPTRASQRGLISSKKKIVTQHVIASLNLSTEKSVNICWMNIYGAIMNIKILSLLIKICYLIESVNQWISLHVLKASRCEARIPKITPSQRQLSKVNRKNPTSYHLCWGFLTSETNRSTTRLEKQARLGHSLSPMFGSRGVSDLGPQSICIRMMRWDLR